MLILLKTDMGIDMNPTKCHVFIFHKVPNNDSLRTLNNKQQNAEPWSHMKASRRAVNLYMKKQVVFFPRENNKTGMFCRNHLRWSELQENHRTWWKRETDLLESRGSWVWSQDSGDPVSQVGAGSLPGARTATVKVTLAWLRTQGCPRDPRSTSQQLTAPHTGEHLVSEVFELKCICKGNRHKKQKLLKYQKLKFPNFSKFHRKMSTMTAILDC